MELSPTLSAYCSRLNDADRNTFIRRLEQMSPMELRKESVARGAFMAMEASHRGEDHPQRLTPARKAEQKELRRLEAVVKETSRYPQLPRIVVTKPDVIWMDYTTERRGRGGAVYQE
ncbi:hypothetical protein [Pantoea sp. PGP6]